MKQIIRIVFIFLTCNLMVSQEKWVFSSQVDFVFPNKQSYFYNDSSNKIFDQDLENDGFLLRSFGIQIDANYLVFKKFSIGVLSGLQTQSKPSFTFLKLGGIIRYYFNDTNSGYLYLHDAHNFSLNSDQFKSGNNIRFGVGFPILKKPSYNLALNIFVEQNFLRLDGGKRLLGFADEIPRELTIKSFGLSVGFYFGK